MSGTVYLIHFERPYKHAKHYTGWTTDLQKRLSRHAKGTGSRLMEVVKGEGILWVLARVWEGDRNLERRLKNWGGASRHCPICIQQAKQPEQPQPSL